MAFVRSFAARLTPLPPLFLAAQAPLVLRALPFITDLPVKSIQAQGAIKVRVRELAEELARDEIARANNANRAASTNGAVVDATAAGQKSAAPAWRGMQDNLLSYLGASCGPAGRAWAD
jgi:hypothetical protein